MQVRSQNQRGAGRASQQIMRPACHILIRQIFRYHHLLIISNVKEIIRV